MATLTRAPSLNGAMPPSTMARVPWDAIERVQVAALPSLVAMNAAYRRETGRNLDVTDSYRALDGYYGQVQTFLRRYRVQAIGSGTFGDVRWWQGRRYVRHSSAGAAAVPGTSNHGWGLALDFGPQSRGWVQRNGARFGWHWPTWARSGASYEPWHIEAGADVLLVTNPGPTVPTVPSTPTPAPITERDWLDMATKAEVTEAVREGNVPLVEAVHELTRFLKTRVNSNSGDTLAVARSIEGHLKTRLNSNSADTLNVAREIRDQG